MSWGQFFKWNLLGNKTYTVFFVIIVVLFWIDDDKNI